MYLRHDCVSTIPLYLLSVNFAHTQLLQLTAALRQEEFDQSGLNNWINC